MNSKQIIIKDSLFDPLSNQRQIFFYNSPKKRKMYKVWIYIEGRDLSFVDKVVYKLHSSFNDPEKKIERSISNPNCTLQIWTWGLFTIEVDIYFQTGESMRMSHYTTYDKDINDGAASFSEVKSFA